MYSSLTIHMVVLLILDNLVESFVPEIVVIVN